MPTSKNKIPNYKDFLDPKLIEIQHQQDLAKNNLVGNATRSGNAGALYSSTLKVELDKIQKVADNFKANAKVAAFYEVLAYYKSLGAESLMFSDIHGLKQSLNPHNIADIPLLGAIHTYEHVIGMEL